MKRASSAAERLSVRSALNPFLWLAGVVVVPGMIMMTIGHPPKAVEYMVWATLGTVLLAGFFLLLFHTDKLQSEEYQLAKQQMEMMQSKGETPVTASVLMAISEPQDTALPGGAEH